MVLLSYSSLRGLSLIWTCSAAVRILRVRRMLKAIDRYDVDKLRKIADAGLGVRGWLRKFSGRDKKEEEQEPTANRVAKKSLKIWAARAFALRKLTPQGLLSSLAIGAAVGSCSNSKVQEKSAIASIKRCKKSSIKLRK